MPVPNTFGDKSGTLNTGKLDENNEYLHAMASSKASQEQVSLLSNAVATNSASMLMKTGGVATGPIYAATDTTGAGNALVTKDQMNAAIAAAINALGGSVPSTDPPTVATTPVIAVQGGGQPIPGAVLIIVTAATFGGTPTGTTRAWQANQGLPQNAADGTTYTIGEGDVGKSLSLFYTASKTGYQTISVRSNALVAVATPPAVQDDRLVTGMTITGAPNEYQMYGVPYDWGKMAYVLMGTNPHGSGVPSWWNGLYVANWPDMLAWFVICRGAGHTATNAGLAIQGSECWILKNSTKTWQLHHAEDVPAWSAFYPAGGTIMGNESYTDNHFIRNNTFIVDPGFNVVCHGGQGLYALPWIGDRSSSLETEDDVGAVVHVVRFRLEKKDLNGVDDLDSAVIGMHAGADYYPNGGLDAIGNTYYPGVAIGRSLLATRNWRICIMAVKKPTITDNEFFNVIGPPDWKYFPDGVSGGGGGGGGTPPPGTTTALDFGGGTGVNTTRYATFTGPALGTQWSVGFRFRANKTNYGTEVYPKLIQVGDPTAANGIAIAINGWGFPVFQVGMQGGTWFGWDPGPTYAEADRINATGADWVFVLVANGTSWKGYYVLEDGTVAASKFTQAQSGTGITSQTWYVGRSTGGEAGSYQENPIGDLFILSRALSDAEVEDFAQQAWITDIEASPVVNLPFRSGGNDYQIEPNLGTGGTSNDATIRGSGWATATSFTSGPATTPVAMTYQVYGTVGQAASSITSPQLSVQENDFITVIESNGAAEYETAFSVTNNGSAITWTQQFDLGASSSNDSGLNIWTGKAGSTPPTTVTVTATVGGDVNCPKALQIIVHHGAHTVTPFPAGNKFSGTDASNVSQQITPTSAGSCLWLVAANWNGYDGFTAGTNCQKENVQSAYGHVSTAVIRPTTQPRTDAAAFTLSETDVDTGYITYAAFEVQAATTAVAATIDPLTDGRTVVVLDGDVSDLSSYGQMVGLQLTNPRVVQNPNSSPHPEMLSDLTSHNNEWLHTDSSVWIKREQNNDGKWALTQRMRGSQPKFDSNTFRAEIYSNHQDNGNPAYTMYEDAARGQNAFWGGVDFMLDSDMLAKNSFQASAHSVTWLGDWRYSFGYGIGYAKWSDGVLYWIIAGPWTGSDGSVFDVSGADGTILSTVANTAGGPQPNQWGTGYRWKLGTPAANVSWKLAWHFRLASSAAGNPFCHVWRKIGSGSWVKVVTDYHPNVHTTGIRYWKTGGYDIYASLGATETAGAHLRSDLMMRDQSATGKATLTETVIQNWLDR